MMNSSPNEGSQAFELSESDLEESFARSSGPGGQHVNKVASAVTLRHVPTGVSVSVQDSRSQATNRKLARARLAALLVERERKRRQQEIAARERKRRSRSPRPRALKQRILEAKKKRGSLKKLRGRVTE
jgi:protein subunit release factor B